jgi:hypothetical protein
MYATHQEETSEEKRRHGEFSLLVEAGDPEEAVSKFRERILDFRQSTSFFEGLCSVYFIQMLEFESLPRSAAMMVHYKSIVGDPVMPYIGCTVPTADSNGCRIYDWKENRPEIDGKNELLFLELNGR